jgi:hypothetical protein
MSDTLDPDIAVMKLSDEEKWGLQIYRNYSTKFGEYRAKLFIEQASSFGEDVELFRQVTTLVTSEKPAVIAVVASSYADDRLKEMFKRDIPEGIPGGRSALLSGFGPLARLSQRIQMAYAFGWLSKDLLVELDHLRKIRNDVSHKWDMTLLERLMNELIEEKQSPIEEQLGGGHRLPEDFHKSLPPADRFRIRVVWILARLTYEARMWVPAMQAGVKPHEALYGATAPAMLQAISAISLAATREIVHIE